MHWSRFVPPPNPIVLLLLMGKTSSAWRILDVAPTPCRNEAHDLSSGAIKAKSATSNPQRCNLPLPVRSRTGEARRGSPQDWATIHLSSGIALSGRSLPRSKHHIHTHGRAPERSHTKNYTSSATTPLRRAVGYNCGRPSPRRPPCRQEAPL